eukprot:15365414-Ditylum_brightwellii.AAC.1
MAPMDGYLQTTALGCGREKAEHIEIPSKCNCSAPKVQAYLQSSGFSIDTYNTTTLHSMKKL